MEIKNFNSNLYFQAKFLDSADMRSIAQYAVEKGKFNKLNNARKNIESAYLRTRLSVDIFDKNGKPCIRFTRYVPKRFVVVPKNYEDYQIKSVIEYTSSKKCNPLKFALEKIVKMGQGVPNNRIFKNVVVKK